MLLNLLFLAAEDAGQALLDGLAQGGALGYVLAGVAVLALLVPVILKALGKDVPIVGPLLDAILGVVKRLAESKRKPAEQPKGVESVVEVKKE